MRLDLQRCIACGHVQHYPRASCTRCGSTDLVAQAAVGTGTLTSFTVVHRAPSPSVTAPYVVAIVRLDEGPSLLTHVVDAPLDELRCDVPVELRWRTGVDEQPLAVFAPRRTPATSAGD